MFASPCFKWESSGVQIAKVIFPSHMWGVTQNKESFLGKLDSKVCRLSLMWCGLKDTWMEKLSFRAPNISSFNNRMLVSQIIYFLSLINYKNITYLLQKFWKIPRIIKKIYINHNPTHWKQPLIICFNIFI